MALPPDELGHIITRKLRKRVSYPHVHRDPKLVQEALTRPSRMMQMSDDYFFVSR